MRKYKLLIVALILVGMGMLCGCSYKESIDIECDGLEDGERVFVLVKPTDDEELRVPDDADITGSEIYTADKDGFVLAEQTSEPFSVNFSNNAHPIECSLVFRTTDSRVDFCENHKVMRLAVCDENWKIKNISDDIELVCSDKFAIVIGGKYSAKTGRFIRTKLIQRDFMGVSIDKIIFWLLCGMWSTNLVLFKLMNIFIGKKFITAEPLKVVVWFSVLSVFNVPVMVLLLAYSCIPYFHISMDNEFFVPVYIWAIFMLNIIWIADWVQLMIYRSHYKREEQYRKCLQQQNSLEYTSSDLNYIMVKRRFSDREHR